MAPSPGCLQDERNETPMVRTLRGFPALLSAVRDSQKERVRWDPKGPMRAMSPSRRKEREPGPEAQGSLPRPGASSPQGQAATTWEPAGTPTHSLQACSLFHPSFQLSNTLIISRGGGDSPALGILCRQEPPQHPDGRGPRPHF